jgi:hypothetical protein
MTDHHEVDAVAQRLSDWLSQSRGSALEIRRAVEREFDRYERVPVRDFVPLLVERQLRGDLRTLARHSP